MMCTSGGQQTASAAPVPEAQAYKITSQTRKVGEPVKAAPLSGASNVSVTQASFGGRSTFGGDQKLQPGLGGGGGSGVTTPLGGARAEGGGSSSGSVLPTGGSMAANRAAVQAYTLGNDRVRRQRQAA